MYFVAIGYKKDRFCGVYESEYLIREILVPKETLYNFTQECGSALPTKSKTIIKRCYK